MVRLMLQTGHRNAEPKLQPELLTCNTINILQMPKILFWPNHPIHLGQWRIQDFPQGGAPTPKIAIIFQIYAENCMKMKEFGPPGGRARPWRPPLDPPM